MLILLIHIYHGHTRRIFINITFLNYIYLNSLRYNNNYTIINKYNQQKHIILNILFFIKLLKINVIYFCFFRLIMP